jgi:tetratricopeptide (TPR) repeat protein
VTNPAIHFYLAGALEMAGQTDEAVKVASQAAALSPKNARFQSRRAWILYHAKRYDDAKQKYEEFIQKFDADHAEASRDSIREARLVLSNISVLGGRLPEAEEWLEQVLDEFPEDIGAMNDLGYLWCDQGKHLRRSLEMVQKAVAKEPDNMAYRDSLGWALYRLGRAEEGLAELERAAAKEDPDGVILDHLGDVYLKVNQRDKAVDAWRRAVKAFDKEKDAKKRQDAEAKIKEHS